MKLSFTLSTPLNFFTAFRLSQEKKSFSWKIDWMFALEHPESFDFTSHRSTLSWGVLLLNWNKMKSKIVHNISNNFTSISGTGLEVKKVTFSINQRIFLPRNRACAPAERKKLSYVSHTFQQKRGLRSLQVLRFRPKHKRAVAKGMISSWNLWSRKCEGSRRARKFRLELSLSINDWRFDSNILQK